jgi:hypothetical protein
VGGVAAGRTSVQPLAAQPVEIVRPPQVAVLDAELAVDGEQQRHGERLGLEHPQRAREAGVERLVHHGLRAVVQVVAEGVLAEPVVRACHQDHLVPRDVDDARRHAERLTGRGQAGEVPLAQTLERDVDLVLVLEVLAQLDPQRGRERVALDERAAPAAPPADPLHGGLLVVG